MAEAAGGKSQDNTIFITVLVAVISLALAFFFGYSLSSGNAFNPNPYGNMADQRLDVTPDSPLKGIFGDFSRYADSGQYLIQNSPRLAELESAVTELGSKLSAEPVAAPLDRIPAANREKITKEIIPKITEYIGGIREAVTAGQTKQAAQLATKLTTELNTLERLAVGNGGTLASTAIQIAQDINKDGKGNIKYSNLPPCTGGRKTGCGPNAIGPTKDGWPSFLDCSGFMSIVLRKVGIFSPNERATVATFYKDYALSGKDGMSLVGKYPKGITDASNLQPGDMLLMFGGKFNHVVMYLGEGKIAESIRGGKNGRSGPQINTLSDKVLSKTRAVIRVAVSE